jgi:hypothetical protein
LLHTTASPGRAGTWHSRDPRNGRLAGLAGACPNKFPALGALGGGVRRGGAPPAGFNAAVQECIDRLGIREVVTYQPLSRYWPLQWDETLIFTGLAIILAGLCFWRVRRSLT